MFRPKSVAVIGASATAGKIGYIVLKNIKESGFQGKLYSINPNDPEIMGNKTYKTIADVPEPVDLAILCIPSKFCVTTVEDCGKKGVKTMVIISAGFKEVGGEGIVRENQIKQLAKQYKMRILGPNCLGLITSGNFTFAAFSPIKGQIGMLSQSGAMMTGLLDWSIENEIGFSAFISLGNKVDADEVDFIEYLAEDPNTKVIAGYIESVQDGEKFFRVVSAAVRKKPIILLKSGRSSAGAKAASSHTGALAGSDIAFDLAFKKAGVIRAETISDLFNYCMTFLIAPIPQGDRFAIITNAGGPGIVCTDAIERENLGFAQFAEETIKKLKLKLPAEANFYNPVDIIGDAPPQRYIDASEILLQCPETEVAGLIILLTPQGQTKPNEVATRLAELHRQYPNKTMVGAFIGGVSVTQAAKILTKGGVPTYAFPEDAVKVLKGLEQYGKILKNTPITAKKTPHFSINATRVEEILEGVHEDGRTVLLSYETSEIFDIYGIKSPKTRLAQTAREAVELAMEIGFPVVMKIVSPQIIHKWDCGGVILNIQTPEKAREAFITIMSNAKSKGPVNADLRGVEVQEMIITKDKKKVNELIFGMNRDPQWGPMLMVGSGGIYANYVKDVKFELAYHYDREDALTQLHHTNISKILEGVRGEPKSDIDGILDILVKISQLVNDFKEIVELDINPCLIFEMEQGYSAVDIKITIKH